MDSFGGTKSGRKEILISLEGSQPSTSSQKTSWTLKSDLGATSICDKSCLYDCQKLGVRFLKTVAKLELL